MTKSVRDKTQAVYACIIEAFFEDGISVSGLQEKFGRSESTINKALAQYKSIYFAEHGFHRVRNKLPKDPRPAADKKALSFVHAMIGMRVWRYRQEREMGPTEFGMLGNLGNLSRVKIKNIEVGAYDLTLVEVEKLAVVLGTTSESLLNPKKEGAHA